MKNIINNSIHIIKESGKILSDYFFENCKKGLPFNVDKKIENHIIEKLNQQFPNFQIISEEKNNKQFNSEYIWVLDPIDGTCNFKNGYDEFCISLGLLHNCKPIFGVIYAPILKKLYFGETENKSFVIKDNTKKQIFVSNIESMEKLNLVASHGYRNNYRNKFLEYFSQNINYTGSASLRLCHVACGINDVNITYGHALKLWDICAGYAIIRGANGIIADFMGHDIFSEQVRGLKEYDNFICSNKIINNKSIQKMQKLLSKDKIYA